jgi:alpha-galactosidase
MKTVGYIFVSKILSIQFFVLCFLIKLPAQNVTIPIVTEKNALVLQTDKDNQLRTIYFGDPLGKASEYAAISGQSKYDDDNIKYNSAYTSTGTSNISEPAIQIKHADGNTSLELKYFSHKVDKINDNVSVTSILLKDPLYPFQVTLFYQTWHKENIIEQWTEIFHTESKPVVLEKYASANLYFSKKHFYLTSYHNRWAKEMQLSENKLSHGIKTFESNLGTRAMLLQSSNFILSFNKPAQENEGNVLLCQLAWSANFKYNFEIDAYNNLRLIAGINPNGSEYLLQPNTEFKTPTFIYTFSNNGTGEASRNLHTWARNNKILNGNGERFTLLNNWEATYFDFNENKITALFKDAKRLGVDLFLLDDGWFGNKYPRNNDKAGLGDWKENVKKLPQGIGYLIKEAKNDSIKFGIWIEPEMVNPKSELYEQHPDWVIKQPERPEIYYRNQLVLDLCNPKVQDYVYGIVDTLFTKNPELAFIKWDCNAVIFNAYSPYLNKVGLPQSHLYVDYMKGLYKVLDRIRVKYQNVPIMLCSGGGARADYEILKYFTEFWLSDNTDPIERVFMQWDYSYFFPAIVSANHVTDWGKQPIKYRVDVACMGKLGFDIVFSHLNDNDKLFCSKAVSDYNAYKDIVWHGNLYRLMNPHENDFASLMYVNAQKNKAVMFNYLVSNRQRLLTHVEPIKLSGLEPNKKYSLKEINLYPNTRSSINSSKVFSGEFLMKIGINPMVNTNRTSVVLEINEVK